VKAVGFLTVSTWPAEVAPTVVLAKVRLAGAKAMMGCVDPVPLSGTDCGEPAALSVATRFAEAAPPAAGLKTMLRVQLAPAPSEVPQVLPLSENWLALVPLKV
jgi:hypothetical protein